MSMDMFLVFDAAAGIKGESKDAAYGKGNGDGIELLAWSWGVSNSGTTHHGEGAGGGRSDFQDISVTKFIDTSTADLALCCATGKHIPSAKLIVRKAGDKPLDYLVIEMTDLIITSYSTGGSGGEDRLTENVSLNFAKVNVVYQKQKKDGTGEKGGEFTFDIAANNKE